MTLAAISQELREQQVALGRLADAVEDERRFLIERCNAIAKRALAAEQKLAELEGDRETE